MQVQVHTPLPHISFLQLLIQFDRCPIWVGYIAFSVDRNSTLVEILYKGTVAPDKLINHQKRQLVTAAGRVSSMGIARHFLLAFRASVVCASLQVEHAKNICSYAALLSISVSAEGFLVS